jgi:carboxymethylenebutenolidase
MTEQAIEITTPDGISDAYLYATPGVPKPGVICLPDIVGIRESIRGQAQRIADAGYSVLLVNPFYRTSRTPLFSFKVAFGEERTMKRLGELAGPLTPEANARDANVYVEYLSAHAAVAPGPLGVVGYCFTGGVALRYAAARPDKIAVAASFHGGRLYTDAPTSPHHVLPNVKARLYFGHADQDNSMPAAAIEKLEAALASWGGHYESELYQGAAHGWTHADSAIYHPEQAERAHSKLVSVLRAELGSA